LKRVAFVVICGAVLLCLSFRNDSTSADNVQGISALCGRSANNNNNNNNDLSTNLSTWMTDLPKKLSHVPLNRLTLPGSHDSGSYWFDKSHPVAPDQPSFVRTLGIFLKPLAAKILGNWALTQRLNVGEQLHAGVRYLDIRTAYLKDQDDFFIVHGLYGHRLEDIFNQIMKFIRSHSKEVVVLHFQYCWDMDPPLHKRYMKLIQRILGDRIYKRPSHLNKGSKDSFSDVTLSHLWAAQKQIVMIVGDYCPGLTDHIVDTGELWSSDFISSLWFKTDSITTLVKNLTDHSAKQSYPGLTVFQAILTPKRSTVAYDPFGSLQHYTEVRNIQAVRCWLLDMYEIKRKNINIVMFDFVDTFYARDVIRLNRILLEENVT